MLELDPDKRPDIYQVSCIAFGLQGKDCPVQNLFVSNFVRKGQEFLVRRLFLGCYQVKYILLDYERFKRIVHCNNTF